MPTEKDVYEDSSDLGWLEEQIEFVEAHLSITENKLVKKNDRDEVPKNLNLAEIDVTKIGFTYTEEYKKKVSESHKKRTELGLKRKPISADTLQRRREKKESKLKAGYVRPPVSEATKQKLKDAWRRLKEQGYKRAPVSQEGRARMSEGKRKGFLAKGRKPHTEITIQKMRDARAAREFARQKSSKIAEKKKKERS